MRFSELETARAFDSSIMKPDQMLSTLRRKLQEVTEVQDVSQHPSLLEKLSRECPNTIEIVESKPPIAKYTCLMHALDFTDRPEYAAIASRGFNVVYAGPGFAHWLISNQLLSEIREDEAREGDLVFYFDEKGKFKHAGLKLQGGQVLSKWGTGHLYRHALFEVPESYGMELRFLKRLSYPEAYEYFRRFAKEKGMFV